MVGLAGPERAVGSHQRGELVIEVVAVPVAEVRGTAVVPDGADEAALRCITLIIHQGVGRLPQAFVGLLATACRWLGQRCRRYCSSRTPPLSAVLETRSSR